MRERTEELEGATYGKSDVKTNELCIKGGKKVLIVPARIVITLMFLACVLFIWHNSVESAVESSSRSGRVTEAINEVLASVGGSTVTEHFIRKLAHFSEYGLEGILTVLLFMVYCLKPQEESGGAERSECASRSAPCLKDMVYCLKPQKRFRAILLTGLFTATIDESIQFFSAGRSPGVGDVCIDMAGFVCGVLLMQVVCYIARIWRAGGTAGLSGADR